MLISLKNSSSEEQMPTHIVCLLYMFSWLPIRGKQSGIIRLSDKHCFLVLTNWSGFELLKNTIKNKIKIFRRYNIHMCFCVCVGHTYLHIHTRYFPRFIKHELTSKESDVELIYIYKTQMSMQASLLFHA